MLKQIKCTVQDKGYVEDYGGKFIFKGHLRFLGYAYDSIFTAGNCTILCLLENIDNVIVWCCRGDIKVGTTINHS